MEEVYQKVVRFEVTAECAQPMHIGSGEADGSILVKASDGLPFIQGTSLAGTFQSYIRQTKGDKAADELFGSWDKEQNRNRKSRIVFSEGSFEKESLTLEMRTRVSINGSTGSVNQKKMVGSSQSSGQVLDMEYISSGSKFSFLIYLFDADANIVRECLAAMHHGILTLGGMSTIGCGKVWIKKVNEQTYDMTKENDRTSWQKLYPNTIGNIGADITKEIHSMSADSPYYELIAEIRLRTPFLIHANEVDADISSELLRLKDGERPVDAMPLMNGKKDFIIPGSSLKGVFRSRMETIAKYLNISTEQIQAVFEDKSDCLFEDAVITGTKEDGIVNRQPRIHINKISGGVMDKKLFSEMTIGGNAVLHIYVEKESRKEDALCAQAILGLLLYVLRDFQIGAVTVGSGAGIGRGYLAVENVMVADGNTVEADFPMKDLKNVNNFVEACMKALPKQA